MKGGEVAGRTIDIYRSELARVPANLRRMRVDRLRPPHVQRIVTSLAGETSARGANATRTVLVNALNDAMRLGIIPRNPAAASKGVRHEPKPIEVWSAEEVASFLRATAGAGAWYHTMFYVAITSGCRSGELRALRWSDLHGDRLTVARTASQDDSEAMTRAPKTAAGRRTIVLPSDTLEELERWRSRLDSHGIDSSLLLPGERGTMVSKSNLRRSVCYWAGKSEVPALTPHGLRHTFASMAIAQGMTAPELARHLGHTDPSFTMRKCVHFFERHQPRKAMTLGDLTGLEESDSEAIGVR